MLNEMRILSVHSTVFIYVHPLESDQVSPWKNKNWKIIL
jgi:hypothetical protein